MPLCITIHLCNTMTTCKEEAHQSESSGHLVHCLLLPHPASCLPQWGSLALDLPSKSFVEFLAYVYSQQIADCDFFWVFIKKIIKIIIFLNSSLFQNHNLSIIAPLSGYTWHRFLQRRRVPGLTSVPVGWQWNCKKPTKHVLTGHLPFFEK